MKMLTLPCGDCGDPVQILESLAALTNHRVLCDKCGTRHEQAYLQARYIELLHHDWLRLCPPAYQDTDTAKLPRQRQSRKALDWPGGDMGLNLWGFCATGKTRTMYQLFRFWHMMGKHVLVLGPGDFVLECERRAFKRAGWIRKLCSLDLLGFDDIDKMCLTKDMEAALFDLIDNRVAHEKPCFFTHNSDGATLEMKFRFGKALVRRMREFTDSIHFPK